jgi:hypothetical protein
MLLKFHGKYICCIKGSVKAQSRQTRPAAAAAASPITHDAYEAANSLIENVMKVAESRWNTPGGINLADIKEELESARNSALSLPNAIDLNNNEGSFIGLLTTNNGFVADETTLGRLTFGMVQPEAIVSLNDPVGKQLKPMPSLYKGVFEGRPMSYVLNTHFLLKPPGSTPLHGLMTMIAQYEINTESSLVITFESMRLSPVDPGQIMEWNLFFKTTDDADPSVPLSPDGVLELKLPQKIKGEVKFILMTHEYQMHIGNGGGWYIMQRKA